MSKNTGKNSSKVFKKSLQIGLIGPSSSNLPKNVRMKKKMLRDSELIGSLVAEKGAILVTGGTDGIMESASKGAFLNGGITVGTPGRKRGQSNKYIAVEICTPIDVGDYLFAGILSCDSIIVFPGGAGTLAEVALAYRFNKPMLIMKGYSGFYDNLIGKKLDISTNKLKFFRADNPKQAVNIAIEIAKNNNANR